MTSKRDAPSSHTTQVTDNPIEYPFSDATPLQWTAVSTKSSPSAQPYVPSHLAGLAGI